MVKISVIIPVFNANKYLIECLNSIVNQKFEDMEIICVDDRSTDNSLCILTEYSQKYPNIKVIQHDENRGASAARNTGLNKASGKYIWFIDSDDYIVDGSCDILYQFAEEKKADVVCFDNYFLNEEYGISRKETEQQEITEIVCGFEMFGIQLERNTLKVEPWRNFVKREFLVKNSISFYEGIICEDMLYYYYLYSSAERIADCNHKLYIYRQRSNSVSYSQKSKMALSYFTVIVNIYSDIMMKRFSEEDEDIIFRYIELLYKSYKLFKRYMDPNFRKCGRRELKLFDILNSSEHIKYNVKADDLTMIKKADNIIIYGAGQVAADIIDYMNSINIPVNLIAVTDEKGNPSSMDGIPVVPVSEIPKEIINEKTVIIVGTDKIHHDDIIMHLNNCGFRHFILPIKCQTK